MGHSFLISLDTSCNLDRSTFRQWADLQREPDWRLAADYLTRVKDVLPRIPAIERDVIELYYFQQKHQHDIAAILRLSQQAVSHRLHSAYRRITFLLGQPTIDPRAMRRALGRLIENSFTVRALCDFAKTSSQTVTAQRLGVPQQRICWHLSAGLAALRAAVPDPAAVFYVEYFTALRAHRNILRDASTARRTMAHAEAQRYRRYARGAASAYGPTAFRGADPRRAEAPRRPDHDPPAHRGARGGGGA